MTINILLVEDDKHIGQSVTTFLETQYKVDWVTDGSVALEKIYENSYDLIILDIMLPNADGHTILKEIRKLGDTPVLMLSALDDDRNQLQSFDNQADDYVTKPFKIALLMKRVEALLRRSGATSQVVSIGEITLYPEEYRAVYKDADIPFTLKEFNIFLYFAKNQNRVLSQDAILSHIYGYDFDRLENTLQVHIKNIRAKLPVDLIKTIRGVGYKLEVS